MKTWCCTLSWTPNGDICVCHPWKKRTSHHRNNNPFHPCHILSLETNVRSFFRQCQFTSSLRIPSVVAVEPNGNERTTTIFRITDPGKAWKPCSEAPMLPQKVRLFDGVHKGEGTWSNELRSMSFGGRYQWWDEGVPRSFGSGPTLGVDLNPAICWRYSS